MPETGDGIPGSGQKIKIKITVVVSRTMPERGRYGGFCLSAPLHAPRSPSTYTAVDVQQHQYVSYRITCVGTELVLVSCRDVQQHKRCRYRTVLGFPFFNYDQVSAIPGSERSVPGRAS